MKLLKYMVVGGSLLFGTHLSHAQGDLINSGANITINSGFTVQVEGAVTNENNGTINNNGNIYLDANWMQTGATTNYLGSGWIRFEGGSNQNIISSTPLNIPNVQVNNNNHLVLGSPIVVSNSINLSNNGNIELGNHNLTLSTGATISGFDANNYIITNGTGALLQEVGATTVAFPVGNSTYNKANVRNSGTVDVFSVRVVDQILDNGTTGLPFTEDVVNRTWFVEENVAGGSLVDLDLEWETGQELTNFDRTDAGLMHYTGGAWDKSFTYGAASNLGGGYYQITGTGITNFSPFGVTNEPTDLPIELLTFDAKRKNVDEVRLEWTTASEQNNKGFEIERMLDYENDFQKIGFVEGMGNTVHNTYYNYLDNNSYTGISYYRLKQIDFDNTFSYSPIRAIDNNSSLVTAVEVYPNPVQDVAYIRFGELTEDINHAEIQIVDVLGKTLHLVSTKANSYQRLAINEIASLTTGSYLIKVTFNNQKEFSQKIIKK